MKTCIIIASGPSTTQADVDALVSTGLPILAVSDSYALLLRAASQLVGLYASDEDWWRFHAQWVRARGIEAPLYTQSAIAAEEFGLEKVDWSGKEEYVPGQVSGNSSGHHAICLAKNLGFDRLVLLGFDYGGTGHYFGEHPSMVKRPSAWPLMINAMAVLAKSLKDVGVDVVNVTRETQLGDIFPRATVEEFMESNKPVAAKTRRGDGRQEAKQ